MKKKEQTEAEKKHSAQDDVICVAHRNVKWDEKIGYYVTIVVCIGQACIGAARQGGAGIEPT